MVVSTLASHKSQNDLVKSETMMSSKFLVPTHVSRRLLPAFSSLRHLPVEDQMLKLWQRSPLFAFEPQTPVCRINEDDKKYSISVDLPGVKASDMKIKLLADNVLQLSGGRKYQDEGRTEESKFGYQFNLANKNIDLQHLRANLSDGVLKIVAPVLETAKHHSREIFINEVDSSVDTLQVEAGDTPNTPAEDIRIFETEIEREKQKSKIEY